ncbi:hypothetical protein SMSP2_02781 [Limihaloglobus sulfuriphilus]|uniref:Ice-binding protein C-terminal domain-containing protein n=1 Tax=Limihaloglobus sulfuriphilus TaxID=1851148 RepID=A0A1Q2MJ35_9BACT|nr:PEP-CTERM sorting domain-containing protein [Limihaloglobus sulfuriphilus]AQQ72397.1 hypothetical protein SMSP2_02781 [Limihaloglobus sulfuriphilus]
MKKTLTALTILLAVSAAQAGFLYWSFTGPDGGGDYTVDLNWDTTAPAEWDYVEYSALNDNLTEFAIKISTESSGVTLSNFVFGDFDTTWAVNWDGEKTSFGTALDANGVNGMLIQFKYTGPDNVTLNVEGIDTTGSAIADSDENIVYFGNSAAGSVVVPEPATMVIFGLGGLVLNVTRRKA